MEDGKDWAAYVLERQARFQEAVPLKGIAADGLSVIERKAVAAVTPLVSEFQKYLSDLKGEGVPFDNDEKRAFAARMQNVLDLLSCRIICPSCKKPASLGFVLKPSYQTGQFVFRHGIGTHAVSSKTFPQFDLIPLEFPDRKVGKRESNRSNEL